ncbi:hypothetical protein GWK47_021414 [Chionoecetes opilio]|uniref:Uncharacterized protein n=1 Tax=Chionoecetes opilio TaxID=41210 RepID=A0A8J5CKI9_CHIOP|nr:hypothetical protein GWK47_021414 [Chionoecetes opilio]
MFLLVLVAHGFLEASGLGNMPGATFTGAPIVDALSTDPGQGGCAESVPGRGSREGGAGVVPGASVSTNFGYMGMWHVTTKLILPTKCICERQSGVEEAKGVPHKARGWGKLMFPAELLGMARKPEWGLACGDPREWYRRVDEATRYSANAPTD